VGSKGRGYREPRRRGFGDTDFSPPGDRGFGGRSLDFITSRPSAPPGQAVGATVKWFNPEKGFGFVSIEGREDAFLHGSALERSGHASVQPGTTLRVKIEHGQKGLQVSEVLEVDASTATPEARRGVPRQGGPRIDKSGPAPGPTVQIEGVVKWFSSDKGFGFVEAAGGGKDVFVHISALQRSGLTNLADRQRVIMDVRESQKGREAVKVRLVE
jgi:CspA family cold shock protein